MATVVSVLGARLDQKGLGNKRWRQWRPNISLLYHDDLDIEHFILIHHENEQELADLTVSDMGKIKPEMKVSTHVVNYEDPWDFEQVYSQLHDFATAYPFDTDMHDYLLQITTGTHVVQICMYLLAEANYIPCRLLQVAPKDADGRHNRRGRYQIINLDLSRYDQIAKRFERESRKDIAYLKGGIETRNRDFNHMIQQIEQVAVRSTAPILLTGATGVGKSQLAKRIYSLKRQRTQLKGQLVEVNCATLRGDQAMSTLFGHIKGAFTGAVQERNGLLREADGGILFLDEIGELGQDEQAMLLRAIEDKTFMPFGSDKLVSSDFQLIAGTNQNLFKCVQEGKFREDLLARINLWTYELPSLNQRREDIKPNIEYELEQFTGEMGYKVSFNQSAKQRFQTFALSEQASWRANFRDLNSSISRMATLASGGRITEDIVDLEIKRLQYDWSGHDRLSNTQGLECLSEVLSDDAINAIDYFDQVQLASVIATCRKSKTMAEAGRKLFNVSRTQRSSTNDSHRLRVYLKKFDLDFKSIQQ